MGSRPRTTAEAERVYDDFVPSTEWTQESAADTLLVYLPGFRKEQLRVQVTSTRNLRIAGERQVGGNKWSRFREEIPISASYDSDGIGAKFEKGILFVKLPKITVPAARLQQGKEQPPAEAPNPQKATQEKAQSPEKSQPPALVPKPDQNARQEKAQPPARVPKLDQKPPQEKAQPSAQVPKPDQRTSQETARSTAEAAKARTSPVTNGVQPPEENPSQKKDKPFTGYAKPETPRGEPERQVPDPKTGMDNQRSSEKDRVANAALQKAAMEDMEEIKNAGKEQSNGQSDAASTGLKQEKFEDSVHGTAKMVKDKTAAVIAAGSSKFAKANYMQVLVDFAMELKKPRRPINLVMAILAVVVFVLYVVQTIRSLKKPEA